MGPADDSAASGSDDSDFAPAKKIRLAAAHRNPAKDASPAAESPSKSSAEGEEEEASDDDDDGEDDDEEDLDFLVDDDDDEYDATSKSAKKSAGARKTPAKRAASLAGLLSGEVTTAEATQMLHSMDHEKLVKIAEALLKLKGADIEDLDAAIGDLKKTMCSRMRSALTWKTALKNSGRASFKATLPCQAPAFYALFGRPTGNAKKLDTRKLACSRLWEILETEVAGRTRFGSLPVSGDVTLRLNMETKELSVSGTYTNGRGRF